MTFNQYSEGVVVFLSHRNTVSLIFGLCIFRSLLCCLDLITTIRATLWKWLFAKLDVACSSLFLSLFHSIDTSTLHHRQTITTADGGGMLLPRGAPSFNNKCGSLLWFTASVDAFLKKQQFFFHLMYHLFRPTNHFRIENRF